MLLFGNLPIALQGGAVNNFFVGRHLLPHRELRERENLVLGWNVLYAVLDFLKVTAHLGNIAARGEMPAFIDGDIPPIGRIIKVGLYILRHF